MRPRRWFPLLSDDDHAWARHAHPLSVWSRIVLGLPLLAVAGYSRAWIGSWSWCALAVVLAFLWINPRMTPPARSMTTWGALATRGERLWLARREQPLPSQHRTVPTLLVGLSLCGAATLVLGVVLLDPLVTLTGTITTWLAKLWYCDRMVWLARDVAAGVVHGSEVDPQRSPA
ncbi:MAG: DUF6653 family protein [Pseudomonadales bacterium]|jgi:hypothetical protein|nr:DUF6653 family protein [Pseudomonadales bacterium]